MFFLVVRSGFILLSPRTRGLTTLSQVSQYVQKLAAAIPSSRKSRSLKQSSVSFESEHHGMFADTCSLEVAAEDAPMSEEWRNLARKRLTRS